MKKKLMSIFIVLSIVFNIALVKLWFDSYQQVQLVKNDVLNHYVSNLSGKKTVLEYALEHQEDQDKLITYLGAGYSYAHRNIGLLNYGSYIGELAPTRELFEYSATVSSSFMRVLQSKVIKGEFDERLSTSLENYIAEITEILEELDYENFDTLSLVEKNQKIEYVAGNILANAKPVYILSPDIERYILNR